MEMRIASAWEVEAPHGKRRAVPPREEVWQKPHFARPLIFHLRTSKVASVHCPDTGGTGHIPGVCGIAGQEVVWRQPR